MTVFKICKCGYLTRRGVGFMGDVQKKSEMWEAAAEEQSQNSHTKLLRDASTTAKNIAQMVIGGLTNLYLCKKPERRVSKREIVL